MTPAAIEKSRPILNRLESVRTQVAHLNERLADANLYLEISDGDRYRAGIDVGDNARVREALARAITLLIEDIVSPMVQELVSLGVDLPPGYLPAVLVLEPDAETAAG